MAKCKICGKPTGCTCSGHWKNIACCIEHFQEYMLNANQGGVTNVVYKLRASVDGVVYDIVDYNIGTDDIELVTKIAGKTISLWDTEYIIVLNDEKGKLLKSYEDDSKFVTVFSKDYKDEFVFAKKSKSKTEKSK